MSKEIISQKDFEMMGALTMHLQSNEELKYWINGIKKSNFFEGMLKLTLEILGFFGGLTSCGFLARGDFWGILFFVLLLAISYLFLYISGGMEKWSIIGLTNNRFIIINIRKAYPCLDEDEVLFFDLTSISKIQISYGFERLSFQISNSEKSFKAQIRTSVSNRIRIKDMETVLKERKISIEISS